MIPRPLTPSFALSPHVTVRADSRKNQQMPIKARLIRRLRYSMQKIIYGGRYLGSFGSHGSVAMSVNPDNVHRPVFDRIKRCPLTFNRAHIMSNLKSAQNPEQTTTQEPNTKKLSPDFSHRLSVLGDEAKPVLLVDAINTSCLQAESTLAIVSAFFTGETENTPSDDVIFWTLHGVMQTIKDIDVIVKAYVEATKAETDSAEAGNQQT